MRLISLLGLTVMVAWVAGLAPGGEDDGVPGALLALADAPAAEPKKEEPKKEETTKPATDPAFEAFAKKATVPAAFVPVVDKAPEIDGVLDEVYKRAAPLTFKFLTGGDAKPTAKTTAYVVSTATDLFVFINNESPDMASLLAAVRDHDGAVYQDDSDELFIDPANKREMDSYVHIIVNSLGTTAESKGPSGAEESSWDPKLKVKCKVDKKAWAMEMQIPFKDLVSDVAKMNKVWAVNLNRMAYLADGNEDTAWSPTGGTSSHEPTKFGIFWLQAGKVDNAK